MIELAQSAGTGPNTPLVALGIAALLAAAFFVNRGWDARAVVVSLVVGVVSVAAAFTVFAEEPETVDAAEVSSPQLRDAVASLCDARTETDPEVVERLFIDQAHAQMHALVQDLGDEHRGQAGDVLVAMQRVEAELAEGSGETRRSMSALIRAAARGLTTLSIEPPSCAQ